MNPLDKIKILKVLKKYKLPSRFKWVSVDENGSIKVFTERPMYLMCHWLKWHNNMRQFDLVDERIHFDKTLVEEYCFKFKNKFI